MWRSLDKPHRRQPLCRPKVDALEKRVLLSSDPYLVSPYASFGPGESPLGPVVFDAAGDMFGVAGVTGGNEQIYEVAAGTRTISNIVSLPSINGSQAGGRLTIDGAGNLFAVSATGGDSGNGLVYEIAAGSRALTTISFDGTNGSQPKDQLAVDSSGNIFGATLSGGKSSLGEIFEIAHGSATITSIASFAGSNGSAPTGVVFGPHGNLFGVDTNPNSSNIFEVVAGSGAISEPFSQSMAADGSLLTIDNSGDIFGITPTTRPTLPPFRPPFNFGPPEAALFVLHPDGTSGGGYGFQGDSSAFRTPFAIDPNGNVIGTSSAGEVFVFSKGFNAKNFEIVSPGEPGCLGVAIGPDGNVFGTAPGQVFEVLHDSTPPAVSFSGPAVSPVGGETFNITVDYRDDRGVNLQLVDKSNVRVTGPDGKPLTVLSATVDYGSINATGTDQDVPVMYAVAAPNGQWTAANNGNYSVSIVPRAIADIWGNFASGSGTVQFIYPPTADIYAPDVTTPGQPVEPVTIVYHGNGSPIDAATISSSNISVTDGAGVALAIGQPTFTSSGQDLTAVYPITPQGGTWNTAEFGQYTVSVASGSVKNTQGTGVHANTRTFVFNTSVDAGFGTIIPGSSTHATASPDFHVMNAITAPDGKIYLVGYQTDEMTENTRGAIERLMPDGSIDPTFNHGEPALTSPPARTNLNNVIFSAAAVISDGEVAAFGGDNNFHFLCVRFNSDGSPDTSFANAGYLITSATSQSSFQAPLAQTLASNGDTFMAGQDYFALFDPSSGDLSTSEAGQGEPLLKSGPTPSDLVALPDGKFLDVSFSDSLGVTVTKITIDGIIDPTFGNGGSVALFPRTDYTVPINFTSPGIALQPNGDILVSETVSRGFQAVRLTSDGALDPTFGNNGLAFAALQAGTDGFTRISVNSATGQFVIVGNVGDAGDFGVVVAAFNPDGLPDVSFGSSGMTIFQAPPYVPNPSSADALTFQSGELQVPAPDVLGGFVVGGQVLVGASELNSSTIRRLNAFAIQDPPPSSDPPANSPPTAGAPPTQSSITPVTKADELALPLDALVLANVDSGARGTVELDLKQLRRMLHKHLSKPVKLELKQTMKVAKQFLLAPRTLLRRALSELHKHNLTAAQQTLADIAALPNLDVSDQRRLAKEQAVLAKREQQP